MAEKTETNKSSVRGCFWQERQAPQSSYHDLLSKLLDQRGIPEGDWPAFLNPTLKHFLPDPFELKDMQAAVEVILNAIQNDKNITIFGDYDVDGATSTALLVRFFKMINIGVNFYIPDREKEGYGPSVEAFQNLHEKGTQVIITVDCGVVAFEPLAYAKKLGLEVVVVDHHAGGPKNPECAALVNPNRADENVEFTYLAAVGVSFLLCVAIQRQLRLLGFFDNLVEPDLISLLDIVALGTVCDVVPLIGLNRSLVTQGLRVMAKTQNLGLRYMLELLEVDLCQISAYHLGFVIGPRINAGGRIGCSRLGSSLLSSDDLEEVKLCATELNLLNEERRLIQDAAFAEADAQVKQNQKIIVVYSPNWHQGVIGIVAGKLKEKYHKPTFVISIDEGAHVGKCSARSVVGFDVGQSIHEAQQAGVILQGGGHPMAGGFSLKTSQLQDFFEFVNNNMAQKLSSQDMQRTYFVDASLTLGSVNDETYQTVQKLAPFGASNSTPKFVFSNITLSKLLVLKEKHIKCFFKDPLSQKTVEGIIFNALQSDMGSFLLKQQGKHIDILAVIKQNHWRGQAKLSLHIEDVRPTL